MPPGGAAVPRRRRRGNGRALALALQGWALWASAVAEARPAVVAGLGGLGGAGRRVPPGGGESVGPSRGWLVGARQAQRGAGAIAASRAPLWSLPYQLGARLTLGCDPDYAAGTSSSNTGPTPRPVTRRIRRRGLMSSPLRRFAMRLARCANPRFVTGTPAPDSGAARHLRKESRCPGGVRQPAECERGCRLCPRFRE